MSNPNFARDERAARLLEDMVEDAVNSYSRATVDNLARRPNDRTMTDLTRQEVDAKLGEAAAKVDARLANFDTSIKTGFADLRAEFAELRTEMAHGRTDAGKQNHESVKWIIGSVFGMLSLSVAIIGVLINLNKAADKPAAAQPAPIIITVPGAAPALAPAQKK